MRAPRVEFRATPAFNNLLTTLGVNPDASGTEIRDALVHALGSRPDSRPPVDHVDEKDLYKIFLNHAGEWMDTLEEDQRDWLEKYHGRRPK